MRLSKIKLAGFKSFVDPMTLHFVSNLTAVAGPNGCGKSNVIDAVRWVMGESSAKNLRGGAATDVIFSGSSARKPVGQATVELLFNNNEGRLGGEYAAYTEIAIKRQVTRDGQSSYFLNGQRCRRKDITDIFLGTGLGPRSYAIIEQGMISRVVESKPEELRVFLEEAAGISKYKERRKETESRIEDTQANLARLNDLKGELETQLRHLERQAQAAARYTALKEKENEMSAQLAALGWDRVNRENEAQETVIRETAVALEAQQAALQHTKTTIEKERVTQSEAHDGLNDIQRRFYSVGADIAKIEQTLAMHQERQTQLKSDHQDALGNLQTIQAQHSQDHQHQIRLQEETEQLNPTYAQASVGVNRAQEVLNETEIAFEEWRDQALMLQQAIQAPTREAEVEKSKISQLERQIHQTQERVVRLEAQLAELNQGADNNIQAHTEMMEEKIAQHTDEIEGLNDALETDHQEREKLKQSLLVLRGEIKAVQQSLNSLEGEQSALQALQAVALGQSQDHRSHWVKERGLDEAAFLAQKINVEPQWLLAVETVLEGFLDALAIERRAFETACPYLTDLSEAGMGLLAWEPCAQRADNALPLAHSLATKIQNIQFFPENLQQSLSHIRVAQGLEQALEQVDDLAVHESIITPQGVWLGQGWAKRKAQKNEQAGVLVREEKLQTLRSEIEIKQAVFDDLQLSLETQEEQLRILAEQRERQQQEQSRLRQVLANLESDLKIKKNRFEQNQQRLQQVGIELRESEAIIQTGQTEVDQARKRLHAAIESMAAHTEASQKSEAQKADFVAAVNNARAHLKEQTTRSQELTLRLQGNAQQVKLLQENVQRFTQQLEGLHNRIAQLEASLLRNEEPVEGLREALEINLERRLHLEEALQLSREQVARVDNKLKDLSQELQHQEHQLALLQEKLQSAKLTWQTLTVRRETAIEKLKNTDYTLESLLANMPEGANEAQWEKELLDIAQKIQRLGAINLAAIEEFSAQQQRKTYLEAQCLDLTEALDTLESAIRKIDKEMREKFQTIFDQVNDRFKILFPKLFGGGQAALTLTGEDLLETGVTLMARPPGKKNSNISQLSGGEKALTAVALVFSIFQLNPAPFCMLDEVDAPLDDSNVGRFCSLVKEMSSTVQFIYVSHNKLAIEMAEQLQGVTMREPGVSRLVTVDIEEAKSLAEA